MPNWKQNSAIFATGVGAATALQVAGVPPTTIMDVCGPAIVVTGVAWGALTVKDYVNNLAEGTRILERIAKEEAVERESGK